MYIDTALANTSITSHNSSQYCIIYVKVVKRVDLTCAHYQKKKGNFTFAFPLTFHTNSFYRGGDQRCVRVCACVCAHACVCMLSCVPLFATPWTVAS